MRKVAQAGHLRGDDDDSGSQHNDCQEKDERLDFGRTCTQKTASVMVSVIKIATISKWQRK
jgi:hypothetical protein